MATTPPSPTISWEAAASHIQDIENYIKDFAGKPGHNPFLYHATHIEPLKKRMANTAERSPELYNRIMSLKKEAPVYDVKPSDKPVEVKVVPTQTGPDTNK